MKNDARSTGFGLLEMMLAMSITLGLTAILFYYMRTAQHTFITESAVSDTQQNFRAALDLLARDIQAAGAGIPLFLGPIAGRNATTTNVSDQLLILYGEPNVSAVSVKDASPSTPLPANSASFIYTEVPATPFVVGQKYLLYAVAQRQDTSANVSDYAEFSIFTLTNAADIADVTVGGIVVGKKLTPTDFPVNDTSGTWSHTVSFPSALALRIVPLQEMVEYQVDRTTRELRRNRNRTGWVVVARGIENLDIKYQLEQYDAVNDIYNTVWVDQPDKSDINNRALIRNVKLTLMAKTQMANPVDGQGQRAISQTVEIAPRNLNLPGFIPNR